MKPHKTNSESNDCSLNCCESFENRLHQLMDQRKSLTRDRLLMEHASQCAPCDEMLSDYHCVDDSIKLLKEDITKILDNSQNKQFSYVFRPMNFLVALSAIVVFCIGVFHLVTAQQDNGANSLAFNSALPTASSNAGEAYVNPAANLAVSASEIETGFLPQLGSITNPETTVEKTKLNDLIIQTANFRIVPDAISLDSDLKLKTAFSVPKRIPGLPSMPPVPTWQQISHQLNPLEPVLIRSAGLPGFGPVSHSFNTTINLLKKSFSKPDGSTEDLGGFTLNPAIFATA